MLNGFNPKFGIFLASIDRHIEFVTGSSSRIREVVSHTREIIKEKLQIPSVEISMKYKMKNWWSRLNSKIYLWIFEPL